MSELGRVFLEEAKGRGDLPDGDEPLERLLEQSVGICRQERRFAVDLQVFIRYLARRLPAEREDVPLAQVLDRLHLTDLYLACACVHQVPEAIAVLEQDHLAELRTWLKRTDSVVDEVCQSVRIQLLVGLGPSGPQLVNYLGHGSLRHWIHVIASHLLPSRQPPPLQATPEEHLIEALEHIPSPQTGAELGLIKHRGAREFRQALKEAFASLPGEQRRLLRFRYVDRLKTAELGKLMGRDQSTASRKLALAEQAVFEETKRLLSERLRLSSQEFDSLLTAIRSSLDLSLSQLLTGPDKEG